MANFDEAYDITMGNEGTYSNDPDDAGQETYCGISRRFNPKWAGWAIIDVSKDDADFPKCLDSNNVLATMVKNFYKTTYWDVFAGDEISSQVIANELYDTGINMGVGRVVGFLQSALNLLNKNGKLYSDISEDGKFGNGTLSTLEACLSLGEEKLIYKIMNVLQGNHYIEYAKKDSKQEKYMRGWFTRVNFTKE
jgi:lysozyme family protein